MKMIKNILNVLLISLVCLCAAVTHADVSVVYYHNDVLGSPVAATDEAGEVLWREDYAPYGEKLGDEMEAVTEKVGYTGHRYDSDTGLTYAGARMYDPELGRFMGIDPVGALEGVSQLNNPAMFNRYAYANNNPYKYVDPDGRVAIPLLFTPPALAVYGKVAAFLGSAVAVGFAGSEVIDIYNESSDPVEGILEGASEGKKTKGRTKNFDKPGGMDQANTDFDDLVDPNSVEPITDSKGGEGRKGILNDGTGRKINVRPNSSDERPTVEIQDGKNKVKIRYDKKTD